MYSGENKILADVMKKPVRKSWGMTFETQALRTLDTTGALANTVWACGARFPEGCPVDSLSCTPQLSGSICSESPSAPSQSTLQRVIVVLKALQFEEMLGTFTLLTGGEVCHLDGSWGDLRGLS